MLDSDVANGTATVIVLRIWNLPTSAHNPSGSARKRRSGYPRRQMAGAVYASKKAIPTSIRMPFRYIYFTYLDRKLTTLRNPDRMGA